MMFNTWRVVKENCWVKYCTDWLRSKYKWRHSNDVIVIETPLYVPNYIPSKTYISEFLTLTERCRLVTYLWNDPCIFRNVEWLTRQRKTVSVHLCSGATVGRWWMWRKHTQQDDCWSSTDYLQPGTVRQIQRPSSSRSSARLLQLQQRILCLSYKRIKRIIHNVRKFFYM